MLAVALGGTVQPAAAVTTEVSEGTLTWGFKESWRTYINDGGTVTGQDGATVGGQGVITFPLVTGGYDDETTATHLEFSGSVHYEKYSGALDLTLSNPVVDLSPDGSQVTAEVTSRTMVGEFVDYGRITVGVVDAAAGTLQLDAQEGTTRWSELPATLAEELSPAFDNRYAVGEALEPLTIDYVGPGGGPVEPTEDWDESGSLAYSVIDRQIGSFASKPLTLSADGSVLLAARGATANPVFATNNQTEIVALDPETLEQVGEAYQLSSFGLSGNYFGADRARNTLFVYSSAANVRRIAAVTWDPQTQSFSQSFLNDANNTILWQPAALRTDPTTGDVYGVLRATQTDLARFTRNDDGTWSNIVYRSTDTDSPLGIRITALAVTSDGTVVITRNGTSAATVEFTEDGLQLTEIPGTALGANVVSLVPDSTGGLRLYGVVDGAVRLWYVARNGAEWSVSEATDVIEEASLGVVYGTSENRDPGSDTAYLPVTANGTLNTAVVRDADVIGLVPGGHNTGTYVASDSATFYRTASDQTRIERVTVTGTVPVIVSAPTDTTATVTSAGATASASFSVEATGSPGPAYQWQSRQAGSTSVAAWRDIDGATNTALSFDASEPDNGRQYRVIVSNDGGRIASDPVTLTVLSVPQVAVQPESVTVPVGGDAQLYVMTRGNPEPSITWQTNASGAWLDLQATEDVVVDGGFVTLTNIPETLNGAGFRAVLANSVDTVLSDVATVTVGTPTAPEEATTYTGVALEWTGSAEMQHQPPNGGVANYFSAGVSDGTQGTYQAEAEGVVIVQKDGSGGEATATWDTRGQHVTDGGSAVQTVRLTDGTATVQPDGSTTIEWPTSFSVNFYDGLVPFTITDPVLTVDAGGTGTLTADLSGYAGDIADPDKPKEAAEPASGVTMATFRNVVVDTENGFAIAPSYAGVEVSTPAGATAQNRTVSGWGAWPQSFVDFHQGTGLAAYFYSTGGTFDPDKVPTGFAVGFDGATPEVPDPEPGPDPEQPGQPDPPTPVIPDPDDSGVVQGSLVWGVKESFRSYIETGVAQGSITVSGGAERVNGVFWFGQDESSWAQGAARHSTTYAGSVRFRGHAGVLDLTFSDPIVRVDSASTGTLLVTVNGRQVAIATLDLSAASRTSVTGGVGYANVPVTLTAEGAGVFSYNGGQFYPAGTAMDRLSFVVGAKATQGPGGDVKVPQTPAEPGTVDGGSQAPVAAPAMDGSSAVEGSLVWGVKQSFRSYVTGPVAKGSISVGGGATTQNGLFRFGQTGTDWTAESGTGSTRYGGSVTFRGHSGILNLTFSNPVVRIDSATSGTLLMSANGSQVALGSLNLASASRAEVSGGVSYSNVPVTLTATGAWLFSYGSSQFYSAGTAMDPLSFVVGAAASSSPGVSVAQAVAAYSSDEWTAPAEPPANTGLYIDPEVLKNIRPGTELTVVGEGYEPNEEDVKVVLYSDPVVLEESLTADASGTATWTGIVPVDTEPGEHTLTFQGSTDLGIEITVLEAEELLGCTVESAELSWGFKESFRSYISGTIAHGEWEVADGATYQTPEFGWADGAGVFDAEPFTGQVSFTGAIRFSGHDGLLDTTVANPTLLFTGPGTAYLLLDVTGVTMEDALAGETDNVQTFEQVSFVELDLSAGTVEVSEDGTTITATDVPTTITSQGYEAFPNYEMGTEFDPVSFEIVTVAECALLAEEDDAPQQVTAAEPISQEEGDDDLGWLWWAGGGLVAAGLLGGLVVYLIRRRDGDGQDGPASGETVDDVLGGER